MLITLQGWPRGQGRDAPMSAIYIHKPHRWIEVMTYNPTSFRIIWKIHKNKYKLIRSSGPAATALSAESRRKYEKSKKISFSLHIILNKFINYRRETEGTPFEAPQGLP